MNWWPILALVLGTLLALVGYFLKRYVDQTDKQLEKAFAMNAETLEKVEAVADKLKVATTSFQGLLHSEKKALADEMTNIAAESKIVRGLISETKSDVFNIKCDLKTISAETKKQAEILASAVKLGLKHEREIKTLIERVGPDTVIVKQKP